MEWLKILATVVAGGSGLLGAVYLVVGLHAQASDEHRSDGRLVLIMGGVRLTLAVLFLGALWTSSRELIWAAAVVLVGGQVAQSLVLRRLKTSADPAV